MVLGLFAGLEGGKLMARFYDGTRMRERYPGEKKHYNSALVVLQFIGAIFFAGLLALHGRVERSVPQTQKRKVPAPVRS